MDTIEIAVKIEKELNIGMIEHIRNRINDLKSPNGFTFCNVIEISRSRNFIIKISYPRYFFGNNAYLVNSVSACLEVQRWFASVILEADDLREVFGEIGLRRVDIPFTYIMRDEEEFSNYENIYKIFAYVYNEMKKGARAKGYIDMMDNRYETVVYSNNGATGKSANNKLMIYNQYENLRTKLDKEVFEATCGVYKDLPNRIRMEVSKRINLRTKLTTKEFSESDILGYYFYSYRDYILEYVLNAQVIEDLYTTWSNDLAEELIVARSDTSFNYEVFILQRIRGIYDYEILRRALRIVIENENTRENGITRIRKVLKEFEKEGNIIVIDVYKILARIRNEILNSKIVE
ncbi:MAG: hypothetical protein CR959_01510 [Fusobacteriales bacterium]|nr:MAG: hypothetical protein CR959_01510 [Fusobacteriales bacterium]